MSFISVSEAESIILNSVRDYGVEQISLEKARGRVLASNICADRDLPPYDRVTMDGIAIRYTDLQKGNKQFEVIATMAAGDSPVDISGDSECIEIMTGCAMPSSVDTVIRYEDVSIVNGVATLKIDTVKAGANVHRRGTDKQQGAPVVNANSLVDATVINMAASVGAVSLPVRKLPRVVIVSTGDELVDIDEQPTPWQVRRSNVYAIKAVLQEYCINAELLHISDDKTTVDEEISNCIRAYDVVILSGGVSMGRFDYVPNALKNAGVTQSFHKVRQRPGKPFWYGQHNDEHTTVFAFPGNPVSAFLCLHRYLIPWLRSSLHLQQKATVAVLKHDISFVPKLQYFLQVFIDVDNDGVLVATPVAGNGSGDFSNLLVANGFLELPEGKDEFKRGEKYPVWTFKNNIL